MSCRSRFYRLGFLDDKAFLDACHIGNVYCTKCRRHQNEIRLLSKTKFLL